MDLRFGVPSTLEQTEHISCSDRTPSYVCKELIYSISPLLSDSIYSRTSELNLSKRVLILELHLYMPDESLKSQHVLLDITLIRGVLLETVPGSKSVLVNPFHKINDTIKKKP